MNNVTNYVAKRIRKVQTLFRIKRFEHEINKGWKNNLKLDGDERIENGILLLESESRLQRYKERYALM